MAAELRRREGDFSSFDGTRLHWQSWEVTSPKAAFAVIHGLGEHAGRYDRFAMGMAAHGFSTYGADLRGMGRSEGRRGHVNSWLEWVRDAERLVGMVTESAAGVEVIPVGHSFGGVVLLSAILAGEMRPARFVLSNPALQLRLKVPAWKAWTGRAMSRLAPALTMSNEVDPSTLSRDPEVVQAYRDDPLVHGQISARLFSEWGAASAQALARASEIRTPFMLIVGEDDRLVDPEGSRELDRRATGAPHETRIYQGRYHEPFNDLEAGEVFADLAAWATRAPAAVGS